MSGRSGVAGRAMALMAALFVIALSAVCGSPAAGSGMTATNCVPASGKILVQAKMGKPGVIGAPSSLGLRAPAVATSLTECGLDFATISMQSVNLISEATARRELGGALAPHRAPTVIARGSIPIWIAKPNGGSLNGSHESRPPTVGPGRSPCSTAANGSTSPRCDRGRFLSWEVGGVR